MTKLEEKKVWYRLRHSLDDYVMVEVYWPGEHWEVEFGVDGEVEIEIYRSDGEIHDEGELDRLFSMIEDGD